MWRQWLRQPQRVWLRRACFQLHLWTGLGIGLYIVVLSLSGSALVYRNELDRSFATPRPRYDANAKQLTTDELRATAARRAGLNVRCGVFAARNPPYITTR